MELLPLFADCDDDDDEPKGALCSRSCWMSFKDKDLPVPSYLGGKIYYQICFHPKRHRNYYREPTTLIISVRQQGCYQNGKRATGRCSGLRDSRVRWNANIKLKKKNARKVGRGRAPRQLFARLSLCVFPTIWVQGTGWGTGSKQTNGKMKKKDQNRT